MGPRVGRCCNGSGHPIVRSTRPHRPQNNGKAEHLIQSAPREWAYGLVYQNSAQRAESLDAWIHHFN